VAKFTVGRGLDDYLKDLQKLEVKTGKYLGQALYEGAKIVADEIHKNIASLPVQNTPAKKGQRRDPSQVEIDGMLDGLGIAKKRVANGYSNVKIGMDGYNSHVTEKYPKGHPNAMVARSIMTGTSFINRHPFVERAVNAVGGKAEDKMREIIENGINETMQ